MIPRRPMGWHAAHGLPLLGAAIACALASGLATAQPAVSAPPTDRYGTGQVEAPRDWARALRDADRRLARAPRDEQALADRALALARLGRLADAAAGSRRLIAVIEQRRGPRDASLLAPLDRLVLVLRQSGKVRDALEPSARAVAIQEAVRGSNDVSTGFRLVTHATLLRQAGQLQDARDTAQRALGILEATRGPDHLETAEAIDEVAAALERLGDYAGALVLAQRSLSITRTAVGDEHFLVEQRINKVGGVRFHLGQHELALMDYERSLALAEKLYGPQHQLTANRLADLADVHEAMDHAQLALPLQERALAISIARSGPDSPATATVRYSLGTLLNTLADYPRALEQLQLAVATARRTYGEDHTLTAVYMEGLGTTYKAMGEPRKALPLFTQAARSTEKALGPAHPRTSTSLARLGTLYEELGEFDQALRLYERSLAITEKALGPEHPTVADRLQNIVSVRSILGQYEAAKTLQARAIAVLEKAYGPRHTLVAAALQLMAGLQSDSGDNAAALPLLERALVIDEASLGPDHPDTASVISGLANVREALGEYSLALPLHERALANARKVLGPMNPVTGDRLNSLGRFHQVLGEDERAIPLFEQSLAIARAAYGDNHPDVASRLNNLAMSRSDLGQREAAHALYVQAGQIDEKVYGPDQLETAVGLNNAGLNLAEMGRLGEALPLLERAVAITGKLEGATWEHVAYTATLANLHVMDGHPDLASPLFERIWPLVWTPQVDPLTRFHVLRKSALWMAARGNREGAIFFGKQAVNAMQALRAAAAGLDKSSQRGLAERHQGTYQKLAGWLVDAGRLAEAEQVLALLKDQELFDLTQRNGDGASQPLGMAGGEGALERRLQDLQQASLREAAELEELNRLQRRGTALDPQQRARRTALQAQQQTWRDAFQKFMADVQPTLSTDTAAAQAGRTAAEQATSQLRTLVRSASDGSGLRHVALSYLVTDEGLSVIVTTAEGSFARRVALPARELNQQVARLRQVLKDPVFDPRPAAQALYKSLLAPVQADLDTLAPQVVVLNLTDVLRYVPFAALHDGQQYMAQRYAFALHTSAGGAARPRPESAAGWHVTGLGLSQPTTIGPLTFSPLPSVPGELAGIVRTASSPGGALPGRLAVDAAFTRQEFEDALAGAGRGESAVLHVASHFHLAPGSDHGSYLVLGDASPLRLSELKEMDFQGVQMLTLSACNTASVGGRNENGSEVEGLAAAVQVAGARSVLATLWPVADGSTAAFMQRFYRLRTQPGATHVQAVRQAQLELITGQLQVPATAPSDRGGGRKDLPQARNGETPYAAPASAPYSHPFFWAPFVLMGSWL